jgi:hypothetical protein
LNRDDLQDSKASWRSAQSLWVSLSLLENPSESEPIVKSLFGLESILSSRVVHGRFLVPLASLRLPFGRTRSGCARLIGCDEAMEPQLRKGKQLDDGTAILWYRTKRRPT